jgi:endonuclease YncB( thermonuclease family)
MVAFDFPRLSRPANPHRLSSTSDGDTPVIDQPVRMVSVDTPEKPGYAGLPPTAQATLDRCRTRLEDGTYHALPQGLRDYLLGRLTADAAERHIGAGLQATAEFERLQLLRLTRADGQRRKVAVIPTGELIDRYGRLLAYLAPWFTGSQADPLPPRDDPARRTFNLDMVASGWGALFVIYPSLPGNEDLNLLLTEAEAAWTERRGAWQAFGEDVLLGYEYRAAIKLGRKQLGDPADAIADAYQRLCVDLRDLRLVGKYDYFPVPPSQRLWIWEDDLDQARRDLDLPAG